MIQTAFLYSLAPFAVLVCAGIAAGVHVPGRATTAKVQHFAAGVIFCAVAVELLPAIHRRSMALIVLGFAAGIAAVLAIRRFGSKLEQSGRLKSAGLLLATGADVLIDGLVIGASFASGEQRGILMAAAISLEFSFLGLSSAIALREQSNSSLRVVLALAGTGALVVAAAIGGAAALAGVSADVMACVLSFGAVAMMYLVTEELLVEAHESEEGSWPTAIFFVGFLAYLLLSETMRGG